MVIHHNAKLKIARLSDKWPYTIAHILYNIFVLYVRGNIEIGAVTQCRWDVIFIINIGDFDGKIHDTWVSPNYFCLGW